MVKNLIELCSEKQAALVLLLTIVKIWKQPQMSINRWVDEHSAVHPYSGALLGFKKERSRHAYYNVDEPKQHGDERKET